MSIQKIDSKSAVQKVPSTDDQKVKNKLKLLDELFKNVEYWNHDANKMVKGGVQYYAFTSLNKYYKNYNDGSEGAVNPLACRDITGKIERIGNTIVMNDMVYDVENNKVTTGKIFKKSYKLPSPEAKKVLEKMKVEINSHLRSEMNDAVFANGEWGPDGMPIILNEQFKEKIFKILESK